MSLYRQKSVRLRAERPILLKADREPVSVIVTAAALPRETEMHRDRAASAEITAAASRAASAETTAAASRAVSAEITAAASRAASAKITAAASRAASAKITAAASRAVSAKITAAASRAVSAEITAAASRAASPDAEQGPDRERAEQVLFSDPTSYGGIVLAVMTRDLDAAKEADLSDGTAESVSFLDGVRDSFNKTFIRENRWKLFVQGILTTLLITALTILSGTVLGFAVFMLCRNGNPAANAVTRFCVWLVQGMPMVVLLMILFYIIFGSVAVSGVLVAVIGFTLTFGAAVFGLLKMGVGAVDRGQYEAAYALGYSSRRTFFRIILPQALPHVLPAYRGEIVSLIKATAIVGYIAVQDLTKMGDIVRSRTYEAFFPLIAITVIYFVLEGLIGFLIGRIGAGFNPRRRKPADILKGVKTDDQD